MIPLPHRGLTVGYVGYTEDTVHMTLKDRNMSILVMAAQGFTEDEIAQRFNMPSSYVRKTLERIFNTHVPEHGTCPSCGKDFIKNTGKQVLCVRCIIIRHAPINEIKKLLADYDQLHD